MPGVTLPHIAFIGKTGAGKTTAAQILVERFGYARVSFAAPLKAGCATTDDRTLLQKVGHGVRELHEDFWVNLFLADVAAREQDELNVAWDGTPKFTVDDCRYPNEAQALKAAGFVTVRITASKVTRIDRQKRAGRLQDEAQLDHISETALDDFTADHRIVNDGWAEIDLLDDVTRLLNAVRS